MDNACACQTIVQIPTGDGKDFRRIGLVEVLWNATIEIINQHLIVAITYHNSLRGFRIGQGTGTVILGTNLLHQLTSMREAVIHTMF